jgi:hypothetical protein
VVLIVFVYILSLVASFITDIEDDARNAMAEIVDTAE